MKKKIKIVHLVNSLSRDGTGMVVFNLCRLFSQDRFEISVVSLTPDIVLSNSPEWPKEVNVLSFNYQYENDYSLRKYLTLFLFRQKATASATDIRECISRLSPDILHCHLQPRELLIAADLKSTHLLFTDHIVRIKRGQYPRINTKVLAWIYKEILKKFHVTAVSKSVSECHRDFRFINKKNIYALIENAIDIKKFSPSTHKPLQPLRVIYVARFDKRKGHEDLVRAWSRINENQNLELVLLGTGEMERRLKSLVEELIPIHPVVFAGLRHDVYRYLSESHIAVFPSYQEGLSIALLEKMACGLPVIASDIKEFKEILTDEDNCLFFKKGDDKDLYEKLIRMIRDSSLRERIGESARQFVVSRFSMHDFVTKYLEVYNRILDQPHEQ